MMPMNHNAAGCAFVYVSNAIDGDIAVFHLNTASGQLTLHSRHAAGETVMPMALSPDRSVLYAAARGKERRLLAWSIDPQTGALALRADTPIESSLAGLSVDPSGEYLLGASYGEHRVSLYRADDIAAGIGAPVQMVEGIEHAHAAITSEDGRRVYVSSLGSDRVFCFELQNESRGRLVARESVLLDSGFGPRHLRFAPQGDALHVLSEFRAQVATLSHEGPDGSLVVRGVTPRPPVLTELNDGRVRGNLANASNDDLATLIWAADLHFTPDGRFLYLSERTSSRLVALRVHADGTLGHAGAFETETQPRGFSIDPSGRFLVACGERSTHVAVHAIDAATGALSLVSRCEGGRGANWIEVVPSQDAAPRTAQAQVSGR
jgi:6-phosphogluconolactonase